MPDTPIAHGPDHPLDDHLREVASLAQTFSSTPLKSWAYLAGLWHDLGKFRRGFQHYVREAGADAHIEGRAAASVRGRDKTHSAAGALHALRVFEERWGQGAKAPARGLAYVIAGHHAGLDNWHDGLDPRLLGGGAADAEREFSEAVAACGARYPELLDLPAGFDLRAACAAIPGLMESKDEPLAVALWIRMLFSALVDADFLDTEKYFNRGQAQRRAGFAPLADYRSRLDAHLEDLARQVAADGRTDDPVMRARAAVLNQCRTKASLPPGVFTLTVPTGGGKTLASLAFALAHAQAHALRRVIIAFPTPASSSKPPILSRTSSVMTRCSNITAKPIHRMTMMIVETPHAAGSLAKIGTPR